MDDEDMRRYDDGGHVDFGAEMDDLTTAVIEVGAILVAVLCAAGLVLLALSA